MARKRQSAEVIPIRSLREMSDSELTDYVRTAANAVAGSLPNGEKFMLTVFDDGGPIQTTARGLNGDWSRAAWVASQVAQDLEERAKGGA
jgi:hypothetical protein